MGIQIGTHITEKFIEKVAFGQVLCQGYQDWTGSEHDCKFYSADGDKDGTFYEAMQYTTKSHFYLWERDHEWEDVMKHLVSWTADRLREGGFWEVWKDADPLRCGWGELFSPVKVTETNLAGVEQCLSDAASDVTWALSESYQKFFQCKTVLCWDDKTAQERYGDDWIEDTQTRLICMVHNVRSEVMDRILEKGHTLSRDSHGHIVEYDAGGMSVWDRVLD